MTNTTNLEHIMRIQPWCAVSVLPPVEPVYARTSKIAAFPLRGRVVTGEIRPNAILLSRLEEAEEGTVVGVQVLAVGVAAAEAVQAAVLRVAIPPLRGAALPSAAQSPVHVPLHAAVLSPHTHHPERALLPAVLSTAPDAAVLVAQTRPDRGASPT